MKKFILLLICGSFCLFTAQAQLVVSSPSSLNQMVNNFILTGVTASNVVFTGDSNAVGTFTGGNSTSLGINDGIILTTGVINGDPAIGDSAILFANNNNSQPGDVLLNSITTYPTYDAAILEFDLVPVGNVLEFQYVFASEEYPEFVNTSFNDIFGFFINGPYPSGGNYVNSNIALIPGTILPVCINNVNAGANASYFVDNLGLNGTSIVYDGYTTVLIAQAYVVPSSTYHLKMAIADVGDGVFDSGIFLKAQSMKSYMLTGVEENMTSQFSIAPNPVNSDSKLNLNLTHEGNVNIMISDISGKVVYAIQKSFSAAGPQQVALGEFTQNAKAGIYMIRIETDDVSQIQKLIKY